MNLALEETISDEHARKALCDFFRKASLHVVGKEGAHPIDAEMATLWRRQLQLEDVVTHLTNGQDSTAIQTAELFRNQPSVFIGILAKMIATGRRDLIDYAIASVDRNPALPNHSFNGRTLLHLAAGAGCVQVVEKLISAGADPNALDAGGHSPLYRASSCGRAEPTVRALIAAGARVNACGATRSTALHQAARFGNVRVAAALLEQGADVNAKDSRGLTPLNRAINCRRRDVAELLTQFTTTKK